MKKKNLPYIAVYVGDWERDCNNLSLEAEMAWMKIIFKMHLALESHYKSSAKALQRLWKSPPEKVQEILSELIDADIGNIVISGDSLLFICRRLEKEMKLSKIRSTAASSRYSKKSD